VAEVDRSTIDKALAFQSVALHKSSDPQPTYRPVATVMSRQFLSTFDQRRECFLQVLVRDNNVDQALRVLKKKMQREGVFREMKRRRFYEKPSERSNREQAEAIRRARKLARKKAQREGLIAAPKGKKVLPRRPTGWPPLAGASGPPRLP
jgi:small subunit ribosomal protein S21